MKKTAYIVISLILALVAFGCERENLSYTNQKKPDTKDSVPTTVPDTLPTPPEKPDSTSNPNHPNDTSSTEDHSADSILLSQFAKRLSGQWKGGMETVYFDWRGVKEEHSGTADITFQLEKEGAHGGAGLELNFQDGKQVYRMPFSWELGSDHKLHVLYGDKRSMASEECRFSGDSLTLVLKDATDGLETDTYRLARCD